MPLLLQIRYYSFGFPENLNTALGEFSSEKLRVAKAILSSLGGGIYDDFIQYVTALQLVASR